MINHPLKVDSVAQVGAERAPELGKHTEKILAELGFQLEEIQALRSEGVV